MRKIFKISVVFILVLSMITGMGLSAYTTDTDEAFNPVVGELEIVQDEQEDKSEEMPAEPGDQTDPQEGSEVGEPTNPEDPVEPEKPVDTESPEEPENPEEPVDPENPVDSENPEKPVDPENPEELVNPQNPEIPPVNPEMPVVPSLQPAVTPIVTGIPSIYAKVFTDKDVYYKGDIVNYTLKITNTGNVDLLNVEINDELTESKFIDLLAIGSEEVIETTYYIPPTHEGDTIINTIFIKTFYGEVEVSYETGFIINITDGPRLIRDEVENPYFLEEGDGWYYENDEEIVENFDFGASENINVLLNSSPLNLIESFLESRYEDSIVVYKSARIALGCRAFEITLSISGRPPNKPIDVILVIDRSGSMESGNPTAMTYAKNAAKSFASQVLGNDNPNDNRIAIVSYARGTNADQIGRLSDASLNKEFTSNLTQVNSAINGLNANGGTNTQAGFRVAKNHLAQARTEANKVVILLSDGAATVSIGNRYGPSEPKNHNNHTRAAYEEGQSIWSQARVFTVGLLGEVSDSKGWLDSYSTREIARDTLRRAQNAGYYETLAAADLSDIYNQISQQLGYSAKDAVIVDKIGDNFDLVEDSLPVGVTYNPDTGEITWSPGTIITSVNMTYKVKAKPEFQGGNNIPTNEYATLTYTNVNDESNQTKVFPVPLVYVPAPLVVGLTDKEIIIGDSVNLGEQLVVTGGYEPYTYKWTTPSDPNWESNLQNPILTPEDDTYYIVEVIDAYGCKKTDTMFIKVIKGKITIIKKVVDGNSAETFPVYIRGDGKQWAHLAYNGSITTINNLRLGDYSIDEVVPARYKLVSISSPVVSIDRNNLDITVTITNKKNPGGYFDDKDEKDNLFKVVISYSNSNAKHSSPVDLGKVVMFDYFIIPPSVYNEQELYEG